MGPTDTRTNRTASRLATAAASTLADELERLCCAETEGKFFDCVTDNIGSIIAALRATKLNADQISRAIEDFIAEPQCDRDYRGNIARGFEMRRDLPKHFGPGVWFSDVAVKAILAALSSAVGDRTAPTTTAAEA